MARKLDRFVIQRIAVLVAILCIAAIWLMVFQPARLFVQEAVSNGYDLDSMRHFVASYGIYGPLVILLLTLLQAFIIVIPLFLVIMASTMVFGFAKGIIISWLAQMIVGYLAFKITCYIGGPIFNSIMPDKQKERVHSIIQDNGRWGIFIARIIPFGTFDLVNIAAGIIGVKDRDFLIGTALGIIPATLLYGLIGASIISYKTFNIAAYSTMILLVVFFAAVWFWAYSRKKKKAAAQL